MSVDEICEACGISKPTFYKYLGSKENLLGYFYEDVLKEYNTAYSMLMEDTYWNQICAGFESIIKASTEFGINLYSNLFIANLKNNQGTFNFDDNLAKTMIVLFEKSQKVGQIRNTSNPKNLYYVCVNASFGYGINWCLGNNKGDLTKLFRKALEDICDVDPKFRIKD